MEKSQTNATCVIMHPLIQAIWGDIWKDTMEIDQADAFQRIYYLDECRHLNSIVEDQGGLAWSPNLNNFPK